MRLWQKNLALTAIISWLIVIAFSSCHAQKGMTLLNVSYDPTSEFYHDVNQAFCQYWQAKTAQKISVFQSHGGSAKQARSVINGLQADVVTLALAYDIDAIAKQGLINKNWQQRLPNNSSPYTSTIVFLVRKGNPKQIKSWDDLIKTNVQVITPNPKTSGGGRWNYLAAWGYALLQNSGNQAKAKEFVTKLYQNVAMLDSGARGSTTSFVERNQGDVLITWENEAYLARDKLSANQFEIITPKISILAEPPVALVDKVSLHRSSGKVARAYLEFLYSDQAQSLALKHYYRPSNINHNAKLAAQIKHFFPEIKLFSIQQLFTSWQVAQKKHFADGGIFDQIYHPNRRRI